jgi:hypothetical protein
VRRKRCRRGDRGRRDAAGDGRGLNPVGITGLEFLPGIVQERAFCLSPRASERSSGRGWCQGPGDRPRRERP